MQAQLWLWLGRWAAAKGLTTMADSSFRFAAEGRGEAGAEALLMLGKRQIQSGRYEEALATLRQLTAQAPRFSRGWCALGAASRHMADMPAARAAYERALELDPGYLDARTNLGEWHLVSGEPQAALACFEAVLKQNPRHYEALTNRIAALLELGASGAEEATQAALKLFPDSAPLYVNLGSVYEQMAKGRDAAAAYRKALELDPECEEAALSLATLLGSEDLLAQASEFIKKQMAVRGESIDRLCRLAMAQMAQKNFKEARATCEDILRRQPGQVIALTALGNIRGTFGDVPGALALFEKVVELRPDISSIRSNICFEMTYLSGVAREEVFRRHVEWADAHEAPLLPMRKCLRQPGAEVAERRLRVGYVSGDFIGHPVGFLVRDILRDHDRQHFEVYCYSQVTVADLVTDQIKSYADQWRETFFIGDEALADMIVADGIDILVDLSGHTANNRLKVFAMRPAPVQVSWIGYFHSTGLRSIDYFITDPYSTPVDGGQLFSETPVYLPSTRFCYSPPEYAPPVVAAPCLRNGQVTFGCFNRLAKLSDGVVAAWTRILLGVPGSRLVLKASGFNEAEIRERLEQRFAAAGLPLERLELRTHSPHQEMLNQYGDIDIALDPFPFNGGMTTFEALWMGVPLVALEGDTVVSRQSMSMLINIGLPELVFRDVDAYVAGAIALAQDGARLDAMRRDIRLRMAKSPLCRSDQFTADLELLYRRMWQAWQRGEKLGNEIVAAAPVVRKQVLHVGCGPADRRSLPQHFQRQWEEVRLDIDPNAMPDIVASMLDMAPVESASMDAVFSSHNIEHLHPHEVAVALGEFRRVLKPDGMLVLTCPDLQQVCALVADDKLDDPAYISPAGPIAPLDILYGHRAAMAAGNLFMAHKTGFTAKTLRQALEGSGFATAIVERGRLFDLWAIAYPEAPSVERLQADQAACFPSQ